MIYSLGGYGSVSAYNPSTSLSLGTQGANVSISAGGTTSLLNSSTASSGMNMTQAMGYAGLASSVIGAIGSGVSSFYSAQMAKENLNFQKDMAAINARMAENTAQSILDQGNKLQSQVSLRAGKAVGAQKASQGARGVAIGEGSAAEEVATTNLMKEMDMMTINANAVRQAWAARTQATNYGNAALMAGTSANSISPMSAAGTSLMNGATSVASSWYRNKKLGNLSAMFGGE